MTVFREDDLSFRVISISYDRSLILIVEENDLMNSHIDIHPLLSVVEFWSGSERSNLVIYVLHMSTVHP